MARAKKTAKPKGKPTKRRAKPKTKAKPKAKPKSPKIKRQLAAADRKRKKHLAATLKRDAESKALAKKRRTAEKARRTKLKKAKARARQLATRARKGEKSLRFQLEDALETMRSISPYSLSVQVEYQPVMDRGQQPWLLMGRFRPAEGITFPLSWGDVGEICQTWEQDDILTVTIHPQRYAFIRFLYQRYDDDGETVGAPEGYSPTGSGPWEVVISQAVGEISSGDANEPLPESMAARYPNTAILEIQVLWSASLA